MKIQAGRYYTILDRSGMFDKEYLQEARFKAGWVLKVVKVIQYPFRLAEGEQLPLIILTEGGYSLSERNALHMKPATRKQIAKYKRRNIVC